MARVMLIADSNFKNNSGAYKGRKIKDLEIFSCQSRKSVVQELASIEEGMVVIACLDMITSDIVKSTVGGAEGAVEVNQLIFKLVDKVDETDGRVAFGVVAPLFWTSHPVEIKRARNHTFKLLKKSPLNNIWFSNYVKDINAGNDGVHLTNLSAERYVKFIHDFFELVSNESGLKHVEFVDPEISMGSGSGDWADDVMDLSRTSDAGTALLPPDDDEQPPPERTATMLSTSILLPTVVRQPTGTTQMSSMSTTMPTLALHPMHLQSTSSMTAHNPLQINSTQARLLSLADQMPDFTIPPPAIVSTFSEVNGCFAKVNRRLTALESRSYYTNVMTKDLRTEFVKKQKSLAEKININPLVRLATRVRIEILHSVAEAMKKLDHSIVKAYCLQYVPKPVIKIVRKSLTGNEFNTTVTFIDAIAWVKENEHRVLEDLKKARDRAGATYRGTMAQHFVILE